MYPAAPNAISSQQAASEDNRLDGEALALVLMAINAAYPSGTDLPSESIPDIHQLHAFL